jgi:proline iminopeptidase
VNGGLAVYAEGSGQTLLLMPTPHACSVGPEIDKPLARLLIGAGFKVITFDPPGSFRSTRRPTVSVDEMVACSVEALKVARAEPPLPVFGHSMATVCAIGLALEKPSLVSALVLIGATTGPRAALRYGGMPFCWPPWSASFWTFNVRGFRLAMGIGNLAIQKRLCEQTMKASYMDRRLAPRLEVSASDRETPASPRAAWATKIRSIDFEPRLHELRIPVLVCAGRHDPQTTPLSNTRVASAIPNASIAWFEHSGHYPFVEEPEKFKGAIGEFCGVESLVQQRYGAHDRERPHRE